MLKYAILGFINYGFETGYEIKQGIDQSTGHFWQAKQSQIYTTLKTLARDGLVESDLEPQEGRPDRRVYTLTEAGRREFESWLNQPLTSMETQKRPLLLKLFFSACLDKNRILSQLRLFQQLHQQKSELIYGQARQDIAACLIDNPEMEKDAILWETTRLFGEMYQEMYLSWLKKVIRIVEERL